MDVNASPTIQSLQVRVLELEKANAGLVAEKESLLSIAVGALQVSGLQRTPLQPEGLWLTDRHFQYLQTNVSTLVQAGLPSHKVQEKWNWYQIKRLSLSGRLPRFNKHGRLYKKRLQGYEVVPFEQGFPLELFVAIVSLADLPTVSRVTQASFACYQLFMPLLLEDVDVEGEEDLLRVLGPPDPSIPRSSRLALAGSFQHIRFLSVSSRACEGPRPSWSTGHPRLPSGTMELELDTLTIHMDGPDDTIDDDDDPPAHRIRWRADRLLTHLNPKKLVIKIGFYPHNPDELCHLISIKAAWTMARWSRLQAVHFSDIPLFVRLGATGDQAVDEADCISFLNLRGETLDETGQVSVTWDITDYLKYVDEDFNTILERLVHKDMLLRKSVLSSFTVFVHSQAELEEVQKIVKEIEDAPESLRCEVVDKESA